MCNSKIIKILLIYAKYLCKRYSFDIKGYLQDIVIAALSQHHKEKVKLSMSYIKRIDILLQISDIVEEYCEKDDYLDTGFKEVSNIIYPIIIIKRHDKVIGIIDCYPCSDSGVTFMKT